MENKLAKDFNFLSLIKFALPTIAMMIFLSLYLMVDGVFVARFVNTDALSAINIVYPLYSLILAVAVMLSSGGSALVAKKLGEQKSTEAKSDFTLLTIVSVIIVISISLICLFFIKPIIYMLGADDTIYNYCYDYIVPILICSPFYILQVFFLTFFIAAGKPYIGFTISFLGGTSNIIFDYVFIVLFDMGITGAALGTVTGFLIQSMFGLYYFTFKRKGTLYFIKPVFSIYVILKSCSNGVAEMIGNLAVSITTLLFNISMMKMLGVDGVAAITIVFYAEFILTSIFYGYASGVAPVFSYNYGSKNVYQLKKIFKISMSFIFLTSILIYIISIPSSSHIIKIFALKDSNVFNIALKGFYIFAFSFFFTGTNIFSAALFTALSNGKVAAIISLMRTFVFLVFAILILPLIFNVNGLWFAVPLAEILSITVSLFYFIKYRKVYNYF